MHTIIILVLSALVCSALLAAGRYGIPSAKMALRYKLPEIQDALRAEWIEGYDSALDRCDEASPLCSVCDAFHARDGRHGEVTMPASHGVFILPEPADFPVRDYSTANLEVTGPEEDDAHFADAQAYHDEVERSYRAEGPDSSGPYQREVSSPSHRYADLAPESLDRANAAVHEVPAEPDIPPPPPTEVTAVDVIPPERSPWKALESPEAWDIPQYDALTEYLQGQIRSMPPLHWAPLDDKLLPTIPHSALHSFRVMHKDAMMMPRQPLGEYVALSPQPEGGLSEEPSDWLRAQQEDSRRAVLRMETDQSAWALGFQERTEAMADDIVRDWEVDELLAESEENRP